MILTATCLVESTNLPGVEPKLYLLTATRADRKVVTLPHDLRR